MAKEGDVKNEEASANEGGVLSRPTTDTKLITDIDGAEAAKNIKNALGKEPGGEEAEDASSAPSPQRPSSPGATRDTGAEAALRHQIVTARLDVITEHLERLEAMIEEIRSRLPEGE